MNTDKTILIVDDHSAVRIAVKLVLNLAGFDKVIVAKDGCSAIDVASKVSVDVFIVDLDLPQIDGLSLIKRLKKMFINAKVLVYSGAKSISHVNRCRRFGVDGFVGKAHPIEDLPNILSAIIMGFSYFPAAYSEHEPSFFCSKQDVTSCLNDREFSVFNKLVTGKESKVIGRELFISEKTVCANKKNIFKKLGVSNMASLIELHRNQQDLT
ncbi:response regulator [Aeromonas veronii]|uniref:response regulator n=1 Tax=Aeromonas veronii TaxID=654 RepID=UPI001455B14A